LDIAGLEALRRNAKCLLAETVHRSVVHKGLRKPVNLKFRVTLLCCVLYHHSPFTGQTLRLPQWFGRNWDNN